MNKFELKDFLYSYCDTIDRMCGQMMSPGCDDDITGELRSEAYMAFENAHRKLKKIAGSIF